MKQGILLLSFTLGSLLSAGVAEAGCTRQRSLTEGFYGLDTWQKCLNYALAHPDEGIQWTDSNSTYSLNNEGGIKELATSKGEEWTSYVNGLPNQSIKTNLDHIKNGTYNGHKVVTSFTGDELTKYQNKISAAAAAPELKCKNEGKFWENGECITIKSRQSHSEEIVNRLTRDESYEKTISDNLAKANTEHAANIEQKTGVDNLIGKKTKENHGWLSRVSGHAKNKEIDAHNLKVDENLNFKTTFETNKANYDDFLRNNPQCADLGSTCSGPTRERYVELKKSHDDSKELYDKHLTKNFGGDEKNVITTSDAKRNTEASGKSKKDAQIAHEKEVQRKANAQEIMEKNQGGFDGRYGTLHSGISRAASELMVQGMGVLDDMGRSKVVQNGNIQAANLAAQGPTVTSRNMIDSQNKVNEETRTQLNKAKKRANLTALSQTLLGAAHIASNSVVKKRANDALTKIDLDLGKIPGKRVIANGNPAALALIDQEESILNEQRGNVSKNLNGARNAQVMNSLTMGIEAAKSYNKARQFKIERDAVRDQDYSGLQNNQNYNIQLANEAPPPGAVDTAPTVTALTDGQILNPETDDKAVALEDQPQFNPTDLDTMAGAPPAPGFGEGRTETPQGVPGGGGGGVGGTQAAQDDGGPQAPAKTKDPVVSYAANDPTAAGRGFSGKSGGGSEGVGIDQAFADLLKKLLPAEEGAESRDAGADQVALGDRAPASDQAAVIGRNQNIFEVIHKRYLKKSQEGAVLYNL